MDSKTRNLTIRWPVTIAKRIERFQRDNIGLHTKTAAVLVLLDRALTEAGYPGRKRPGVGRTRG